MWKGSTAPEDASWAVLPASRTSSVAVNAAPGEFSTTQLRISIDPQLRITVADLSGNILQKEAALVRWDGPLFLEFPHATGDGTPFDLSGSEFLLGSRLLIAPNPSPEEVAPYTVNLPPGTWYDYWTGEQFTRGKPTGPLDLEQRDLEQRDLVVAQKQLTVTPKLETLPVYVRGGSILRIPPLTQSTAETPQGPLTLRVYPLAAGLNTPGESCQGDVYTDDGHTFA